ncbi:MAG: sigma-54 dependent transcriptional regulator [Candidatus Alcyoniella australis]|nr:sigma-54 dependent transcriptional regulator [Candidatus Alcyoniella australis]
MSGEKNNNSPGSADDEARKVLIVDDEEGLRHSLGVLISKAGYQPVSASDVDRALELLGQQEIDLVLCDIRMPKRDGFDFLRSLPDTGRDPTVIMMSAYGSVDTALEALRQGAYDYISKPFKSDEIVLTLRKAVERERLRRENAVLKRRVQRVSSFEGIITRNKRMQSIFDLIDRLADHRATVLIAGESGTGKELVARAVHQRSPRASRPFVAINCGAIPETLLESELFGHARGSFTGAVRDRPGLIEEAHSGTLFLDEIGELPKQLQVKLLRVLQEREVRRLGESKSRQVDVRIISATVRDLAQEVRADRFREDLYYRINVFPIELPPLKERAEDVPLLADHFIQRFNQSRDLDQHSPVRGIGRKAMQKLMAYSWPGNVRELENVIERAMVLVDGDMIEPEHLPTYIADPEKAVVCGDDMPHLHGDLSVKRNARLLERKLISSALGRTGGNRSQAARLLSISHRALLYKIKEYEIK